MRPSGGWIYWWDLFQDYAASQLVLGYSLRPLRGMSAETTEILIPFGA